MSPTEVEHMPIRLHVYLEGTPSGAVWWSESPDVPGFHATDVRLQNLLRRSEIAIYEILGEMVVVNAELVGEPPASEGERVSHGWSEADPGPAESNDDTRGVVASSVVRTPVAA
ncbi:hypothetical protein BH23ACT10_BH23ACT10_33480 [soil metagenome]